MLYYDRNNAFEGADVNKRSESKECNICHYWYFQIEGLSFNQMFAIGVMMY